MQNHNESELIAHSLRGDTAAYGELVDRYKKAIYHHCFAIVRDEDAAEDIAQETFIAAFYKLASYDARHRFSTWLFKIATNQCFSWLRKSRREITADDSVSELAISPHPGPAAAATYAELHRAVANLPTNYRAAISLYYWQGQSYEEVASSMGAPVGSVRAWLHRAKTILRKELS